ncbi:MAG: asparagine synthase (glutamine-hydrolyzing) [Candidatus Omnitrophota bacterium]|nr:asparagine synthase (glutamine-hydrolyzing) [Candidatus Omnitrophota bacterium]
MCGICGIYNFNKKAQVNPEHLRQMCEVMRHRGPDDQGFYVNQNLGLGHLRLSIIDIVGGHQPMFNENNSILIVHNGEIYNFLELREELLSHGHIFKTNSDTEVIIHAYEEYGKECVNKFNGMWAFVIWDKNEETLFCSRDRFGIKPFYYYYDGNKFIFASEIKTFFVLVDIEKLENFKKTYEYIVYGNQDSFEETMFRGIYQLKAGHNLILKNKRINIYRYWDLKDSPNNYDLEFKNKEKLYSQFRDLLFSSVLLHRHSDVDVWTLLSGGLDSSALVCVQKQMKEQGLINSPIKTISIVHEQKEINEYEYVKEVLDSDNIINYAINCDEGDVVSSLEKVVYIQDEPFSQMITFNHYFLMKKLSENRIKVVLSGQGADECLAGYLPLLSSYYFADLLRSFKILKLLEEMKHCIKRNNPVFYPMPLLLMQMIKSIVSRRLASFIKAKFVEKSLGFISKEFNKFERNISLFIQTKKNFSILNNNLYRMLMNDSLPRILRLEDRNSMSFSIEERVPFLDYRLVEFFFSLSNSQKIDNGVSKKILRESLKGILPEKIRTRITKLGFNAPEKEWLRSEKLFSYLQDINYKQILSTGLIDRNLFETEFKKFREGTSPYRPVIWRAVNYIIWKKVYGIA